MAVDPSLIVEARDLQFDDVFKAGDQVVAKYNADFSAITGNNFLDGIKMPLVAHVQLLIDVVAPASLTPQIWMKWYHRYGRNAAPNDSHIVLQTHEDTGLASRIDLTAAEMSTNGLVTATPFPYYFTTGRSAGAEPHIWNKSACFLQFVSVDAGDTGEMNFTLVITDLRKYYGLA